MVLAQAVNNFEWFHSRFYLHRLSKLSKVLHPKVLFSISDKQKNPFINVHHLTALVLYDGLCTSMAEITIHKIPIVAMGRRNRGNKLACK